MSDSSDRTERRTRSDLRAMTGDGIAFSVMVGIGESYIALFALALGFGDIASGLVATMPMVAGAVLQLVTPAAVGWLGSHKRWVVLCAALQAASFLPLASGALAGDLAPTTLFVVSSLYWGLGMATGPAWNTWVGTIVPRPLRAKYFAFRGRWAQVAVLGGLALGSLLLELGRRDGSALDAYAAVFFCAFVARSVSASFLARHSEPQPIPIGETRVSPAAIRKHLRDGGHGKVLAYLLVFQFSVWTAAPFFTPYMLGPLGLDYIQFATLTGAAFAARIVAFPWLGRVASRSGTRRLLGLASLGIVPIPILWLVSNSFAYLLALQLISGTAWGAFELAALLSFFEHIPERSRTSILTAYNAGNAMAIAGGSVVGAVILNSSSGGASTYALLFAVSAGARLLSLWMFLPVVDVRVSGSPPIAVRTVSVRPSAGALQRPVLAALVEEYEATGITGGEPCEPK